MESPDLQNTFPSEDRPAPSGFQLIIERGLSKFPVRPVVGERYLIGAGSNCQLQLSGEIPLLHSIIIPEGDHLWIDAVSPAPLLFVNGQHVRDSALNRGDVLAIGEFVFCVDYRRPVTPGVPAHPVPVKQDLSNCTPAELVEMLERKLIELDEFELTQRTAAAAMKQAASRSSPVPQIEWTQDPRASLLQMLAQLNDRSRALDVREAALAEHADKLAESQEELRRQLELLCRQQQSTVVSKEAEHRRSA